MSNNDRVRKLIGSCPIVVTCILLTASPSSGGEELDLKSLFYDSIPPSPFINVVYRCADTMLEHGRDTYGPQKTGMLLSAMDRKTLAPLKTRPTAPQSAAEFRPGQPGKPLVGASPPLDQNVLRLLYFLVGLSGEERYGQAADEELEAYLENGNWEAAGMLPWGKHTFWDVMADKAACSAETPADEFLGPWMLWETCFRLAPDQSRRIATRMQRMVLPDQPASEASGQGEPGGGLHPLMTSKRQQGFLIRTFAEAYAHTGDTSFLAAIEVLLARAENGSPAVKGPAESAAVSSGVGSRLSLAIDCDGAARKVPNPLRARLTRFAARQDRVFCSLSHDLKGKRGFVVGGDRETVQPDNTYTSLWKQRPGEPTTAAMAMMCVSRYENTGKTGYRDLIVSTADAYLDSLPEGQTDAWPLTFGHVISLELAAFRITAEKKYHQRAFEVGEIAVKTFFGDSPLPRASTKTEHYEATTGAGTLLLALTELHLTTLHITAVRAPVNTIDR